MADPAPALAPDADDDERALSPREREVERGLLAAIAARDDHARLVYADWLEERGDSARAEYVRLQATILAASDASQAAYLAYLNAAKRLRELAGELGLGWRLQVARPAVEGCRAMLGARCAQDWGQLQPTEQPRVRTCTACDQPVRYCLTETEAYELEARSQRVVIDFAPFEP